MNINDEIPGLQKTVRLDYKVEGILSDFVKIKLSDGEGQILESAYGGFTKQLVPGLYEITTESDENVGNKIIRIDKDTFITDQSIASYSSIPVSFLKSSYNYYTNGANEWSQKSTIKPNAIENTQNRPESIATSLFIFLRYPDQENWEKRINPNESASLGKDFELLNSQRKVIFNLESDTIYQDNEFGYLAFNTPLKPGMYYLVYKGEIKREIPLQVFKDWQTQLFITFKNKPIFETARVLLARIGSDNSVTQEEDKTNSLEIDTILRRMFNGIYTVPPSLVEKTGEIKWFNPVYGLVVCYSYFLSGKHESDNIFKNIIFNIVNNIMPGHNSSDLKALQFLAASHFKENLPEFSIEEPCIYMAGTKVLMQEASNKNPRITLTGMAQKINNFLFDDSVLTSYRPLP